MSESGSIEYEILRGEDYLYITVDYTVADYYPAQTFGLPEDSSPAEGGEVEELTITYEGKPFKVTDEEEKKIEEYIYEHHEYGQEDYYD